MADQEPLDALETRLAEAWRDVLDLPALPSRNDDFFGLGGHSLLAIRLSTRIRREFGADLPMAELFAHSRLAAMADLLRLHEQVAGLPTEDAIAAMSEQELNALIRSLEPAS
jgi:hypothetical protein